MPVQLKALYVWHCTHSPLMDPLSAQERKREWRLSALPSLSFIGLGRNFCGTIPAFSKGHEKQGSRAWLLQTIFPLSLSPLPCFCDCLFEDGSCRFCGKILPRGARGESSIWAMSNDGGAWHFFFQGLESLNKSLSVFSRSFDKDAMSLSLSVLYILAWLDILATASLPCPALQSTFPMRLRVLKLTRCQLGERRRRVFKITSSALLIKKSESGWSHNFSTSWPGPPWASLQVLDMSLANDICSN